jgi:predicted transcriptional regulator of viral defense system
VKVIDLIMEMAKENNGMITTAMIVKAGFSRGNLKYLVDKGRLEKASRGIYILPEIWEDDLFNLQSRFKRGIFSNETALYLWDLTDRTPSRYSMTFPSSYNLEKVKKERVNCSQSEKTLYNIGIVGIKTPSGNIVQAYCMERTLCDILRTHNHIDIQVVTDTFKRYVKRADKSIPELSKCAKIFRVEKKLRNYLEVLL